MKQTPKPPARLTLLKTPPEASSCETCGVLFSKPFFDVGDVEDLKLYDPGTGRVLAPAGSGGVYPGPAN